MKKIVLAALVAGVAMTGNAKADERGNFCGAMFASAANYNYNNNNPQAGLGWAVRMKALVDKKQATLTGIDAHRQVIVTALMLDKMDIDDFILHLQGCVATYTE